MQVQHVLKKNTRNIALKKAREIQGSFESDGNVKEKRR